MPGQGPPSMARTAALQTDPKTAFQTSAADWTRFCIRASSLSGEPCNVTVGDVVSQEQARPALPSESLLRHPAGEI